MNMGWCVKATSGVMRLRVSPQFIADLKCGLRLHALGDLARCRKVGGLFSLGGKPSTRAVTWFADSSVNLLRVGQRCFPCRIARHRMGLPRGDECRRQQEEQGAESGIA